MHASSRRLLPRLGDRLRIGDTGLFVSPFCLGMLPLGAPGTVVDAFDAGINFFFLTADMHWPHYETLRRGLSELFSRGGGVRDDIVVAAVSYLSRPGQMVAPFREVLECVPGLERLDVIVCGWAVEADAPERLARIQRHKAEGFCGARAAAASYHDRAIIPAAVNEGAVDLAFIRYNAGHPGAREDVFPFVDEHAAPLFGFKSMTGFVHPDVAEQIPNFPKNTWLPEPADHYRFALSSPKIRGVLCSLKNRREIEDLEHAMARGALTEEEEEHMIDLAYLADGQAEIAPEAEQT